MKRKEIEEWIEEKARRLYEAMQEFMPHAVAGEISWIRSNTRRGKQMREDFIRSLIEDFGEQ